MKIEHEGQQVEVYTADEVQQRETAARQATEAEYKPKVEGLEKNLGEARTALAQRAGEFAQFRKLSDDQVAKLEEKDRIIYENQLSIQTEREKNAALEKERKQANIESVIRSKVGTDDALFGKVKDAYSIVQLADETPEQISSRVLAAVGVVTVQDPSIAGKIGGFGGGGAMPPLVPGQVDKSFADTDKGKAAGAELGLTLETPKQ